MSKAQHKPNVKVAGTMKQQNIVNNKKKMENEDIKTNYLLFPIFFIIALVPLIAKLKEYNPKLSQFEWFLNTDTSLDVFLYYKHWFLLFTAAIMVIIIVYKAKYDKNTIKFTPIFIPLFIYALFIIISTIFSKYISHSISGGFEQFESVFVLLGYCVFTYYAFITVTSEKDLKVLIYIIIGAVLIMSIIGVMQFTGHDIFMTKAGKNLISPNGEEIDLQMNFEKGRVYLTLYNPNYVGVYAALFIPMLTVFALLMKNIKIVILSIIGIVGMIISVIGSLSLTGFICIIVSMVFFVVIMWRYLIKKFYITVPVLIVLILSLFVMNIQTDRQLEYKLKDMLNFRQTTYNTTSLETNNDNVSLTYKGNKLFVQYVLNDNQTATILPYDENNKQIQGNYDEATNTIYLDDERFSGITIGNGASTFQFYITIDGVQYNFINNIVEGTYYYINSYGRSDKIVTAPSAVFTGYESIASSRGYIWSRTIPLLKDYLILGSGPDTYTMVFPQNDYLNLSNAGFAGQIMTKPHSLYLQIAVQTGVLSLVAFLIFYAMYFVSSILLFMREKFKSIYSKVGVAIFIGSISYMIAGITNDSSVTTAPLFWVMIGAGISVNYKSKALLVAELEKEKVRKAEIENKIIK